MSNFSAKQVQFAPRGANFGQNSSEVAQQQQPQQKQPQLESTQFSNKSTELTRNDKYRVSKLAAVPSVLSNPQINEFSGEIDQETSHGLITSPDLVYVWDYNSADGVPMTVQLPVVPSNLGMKPLAVLINPSAGSNEPGVVVINTFNGFIRFYENFGDANSIGFLKNHKGIQYELNLFNNESIQLAKNIEPAGILLTTTFGRVILLSLRDSAGKPFLSTAEIIHKQTGFFSSRLPKEKEIVSIKCGEILGQGERIIATITSGGFLQTFSCVRDGQSKVIAQHQLLSHLINHIKELYPNSIHSLEVLDFALLQNQYLILTSFRESMDKSFYILFTIKKDENELSIVSAYRLNTYTTPLTEDFKPTLYVPDPYTTALIVFPTSVVLAELVTIKDNISALKYKWEDIVKFRSDINIIGHGYENQIPAQNKNSNICLIIPSIGILRIEKLPSSSKEVESFSKDSIIKSHIEQAVYYGNDSENPIEFDFPENLNINYKDEISKDLLKVANEILSSTSSYIPPRLTSLGDHLELRQKKFEKLLKYTHNNFQSFLNKDELFELIFEFEKLNCATIFYKCFENLNDDLIIEIFNSSINKLYSNANSDIQNQSSFFINDINKFDEFLQIFLELITENLNNSRLTISSGLITILTNIFYKILEIEKNYRYDLFSIDSDLISTSEPWFVVNNLIVLLEEIFNKFISSLSNNSTNDANLKSSLIEFTEILFYLFQQKLKWLDEQPIKTREIQQLIQKITSLYELKSSLWTRTLVLFDSENEALAIAETYKDLKSLVEISNNDLENAKDENELDSIYLRFDHYFKKFEYKFAETLYNYYINSGKFQNLLLGFPQYNFYLKKFLSENDHGKISWIRNIIDQDYENCAKTLLKVTKNFDESQSNKRLQLSIAKLSAIVSLKDKQSEEDNELIEEIQEELNYVEVQDLLLDQVSQYLRSDTDTTAQVDSILNDLLNQPHRNQIADFKIFVKSAERALIRLLSSKSLTVNELIDCFTLLNSNQELNFYHSLKLIYLSNLSYVDKLTNVNLVWRRCLLADDWSKLLNLNHKSTEFIKESTENSIFYKTLINFFNDELYVSNNDFEIGLPNPEVILSLDNDLDLLNRFKFINQNELTELKKEISLEIQLIQHQFTNNNLDEWIKGIIGTANEQSGANKVINYTTLKVEH